MNFHILLFLAYIIFCIPSYAEVVTQCDKLASHPDDPRKITKGIEWDDLNPKVAITACNKDIHSYPKSIRLQYLLGRAYHKDKKYKLAMKYFLKAAVEGYPSAQTALGKIYYNGEGVKQDTVEAVKWFRKAAEKGYVRAQIYLGINYEYGKGVVQNKTEAVKWYAIAAKQGNAEAQTNLGTMFEYGEGVKQDTAEAVKWYTKAAKQGYTRAETNLGVMYENGDGIEQDTAEAIKWYAKAAKQGYAKAQTYLGTMFEYGEGVKKDTAEAVKWYAKAAKQGYAGAQFNLAIMTLDGRGTEQNETRAIKLLKQSTKQEAEIVTGNYTQQFLATPRKSRAIKLATSFKNEGYKPYITIDNSNNKKVYSVRIGVFKNRVDGQAELELMKKKYPKNLFIQASSLVIKIH